MKQHRMRLYGKKATEEEITNEISKLLLGDSDRRQIPLTVSDAARTLGYTRSAIYFYVKKAVEKYHLLQYDPNGRLSLPKNKTQLEFQRFSKNHEIIKDPLVAEWMQDLLTRKGGKPVKCWNYRIFMLESVCNTCNIHPRQLLQDQKITEKIMKNFAQLFQEGKAVYRTQTHGRATNVQSSIYQRVMAVRDFCSFFGVTWRRGINGIMSGKVPGYAKYADVRLSFDEIEEADMYIKQRWGLDSDIYRWFFVGIESCCRFSSLYNLDLEYTKHTSKTGNTTYIMTAYETKTEEIKGGKWIKYITRPDTQKSLDLIKSRGGKRIHESHTSKSRFISETPQKLREIYQHLGKTNSYFYSHSNHALRHIGAQYWLARKDYNYGLVAIIGGWNTMDELKKSYGEMPPEKVLEMIEGNSGMVSLPLLH